MRYIADLPFQWRKSGAWIPRWTISRSLAWVHPKIWVTEKKHKRMIPQLGDTNIIFVLLVLNQHSEPRENSWNPYLHLVSVGCHNMWRCGCPKKPPYIEVTRFVEEVWRKKGDMVWSMARSDTFLASLGFECLPVIKYRQNYIPETGGVTTIYRIDVLSSPTTPTCSMVLRTIWVNYPSKSQ